MSKYNMTPSKLIKLLREHGFVFIRHKANSLIAVIIVLVVLSLFVGAGSYYLFSQRAEELQQAQEEIIVQEEEETEPVGETNEETP